ncbi:MAG: radical SAM protein [Sphingobacteriales bacterium JAD_PAG50586_3]|nr:MAG: radical SAM protein [Sphingobacteriales bacterium JAD_PAG50586_3]
MQTLLPTLKFNDEHQHFEDTENKSVDELVSSMHIPLSLTFQLTRNCNFECIYCSEPLGIRTRSLEEMKEMVDKLKGMRRIIFSGGEPMVYKHFWEVLEHAQGKFEKIVLSTNASRITTDDANRLKDLVDYVDITVDGPRKQHDMIRGKYSDVIRGIRRVAEANIPLSIICVYLPGNRDAINYICHTGDIFEAVKVKILTPIPKGMSINIFDDFVTGNELVELKRYLQSEKEKNGWKSRITITDWMKVGKGHAILIEPDGRAIASPVWGEQDCIKVFGNLHQSDAETLWKHYDYKDNHLKKYLEHTLILA